MYTLLIYVGRRRHVSIGCIIITKRLNNNILTEGKVRLVVSNSINVSCFENLRTVVE